ncbi:MAG: ABC transporter permease [Candidatus Latescibacterota bacterium]
MLWLKLGWRNLRRNRRRTVIELVSIAGSVFLAIFFNNMAVGSYSQMIENGVRTGSGHIGIYHADYLELRKVDQTIPTGPALSALERDPDVAAVYTRLYVPGLIRSSRNSRPGIFLGLDFSRERASNPLLQQKRFISGGFPASGDSTAAVLGAVLADDLKIGVGNKFVFMTQDASGEIVSKLYRVSGIIRTGVREFDAGTVLTPREGLAELIGREGEVHEIAIMLRNINLIPKALPRVGGIAETIPNARAYEWSEAMPGLAGTIRVDHAGLQITVVFLYLIVGIGTINTLLMSVMERTREFGVIRALGLGRRGILKIVFAEAFVLAVIGVSIGVLLSVLAGLFTSTRGIDFGAFMGEGELGIAGTLIDPVIYTGWDWPATATLAIAMVFLALVASLYPAYHVLRVRPSEAMRGY